jgi:hypothetical protein
MPEEVYTCFHSRIRGRYAWKISMMEWFQMVMIMIIIIIIIIIIIAVFHRLHIVCVRRIWNCTKKFMFLRYVLFTLRGIMTWFVTTWNVIVSLNLSCRPMKWLYLSSEFLCSSSHYNWSHSHMVRIETPERYIFSSFVCPFCEKCSRILWHLWPSAWRQKPHSVCMKYDYSLVAENNGLVSVSKIGCHYHGIQL